MKLIEDVKWEHLTNKTGWATSNANTWSSASECAKAINYDYATNQLNNIFVDDINKKICAAFKYPDHHNILESVSDDELIAEIKKRKIPVSKLIPQHEYDWKHHRLMTNNLRYLI